MKIISLSLNTHNKRCFRSCYPHWRNSFSNTFCTCYSVMFCFCFLAGVGWGGVKSVRTSWIVQCPWKFDTCALCLKIVEFIFNIKRMLLKLTGSYFGASSPCDACVCGVCARVRVCVCARACVCCSLPVSRAHNSFWVKRLRAHVCICVCVCVLACVCLRYAYVLELRLKMYEVFLLSGITALIFDSTFFACCLVILFSPFALLSSEVTLCTLTDVKL